MDRTAAFLAHAIVTGKANLTPAEVDRLQKLATSWLPVGTKVVSDSVSTGPPAMGQPQILDFTGTIAEWVDDDRVRVTTDTPVEVDAGDTTSVTSEIVVPVDRVKPATP